VQEYNWNFPLESAEVYTSGPMTIKSDSGGSVSFEVGSIIESESEYEVKLADHMAACHKVEAEAMRQHISSRIEEGIRNTLEEGTVSE
jgi:hypothetical protein